MTIVCFVLNIDNYILDLLVGEVGSSPPGCPEATLAVANNGTVYLEANRFRLVVLRSAD